jgi:hypothetical protein
MRAPFSEESQLQLGLQEWLARQAIENNPVPNESFNAGTISTELKRKTIKTCKERVSTMAVHPFSNMSHACTIVIYPELPTKLCPAYDAFRENTNVVNIPYLNHLFRDFDSDGATTLIIG